VRIEEELKRKPADLIVEVEQLTLRIKTVKKQVSAIDQVIAIYDPAHQASSAVKPNRKQASLVLSAARGRRVAYGGPRLRAAYIEDAQSFLTYSLAPTTTVGLIPNDARKQADEEPGSALGRGNGCRTSSRPLSTNGRRCKTSASRGSIP
jgi:hypothetical protein